MKNFFSRLFGTVNDRKLREFQPRVERINLLEEKIKKLSDSDLKNQTEIFKSRLSDGSTEDDILEEAFATVREAAFRSLGQRVTSG